MAFRLSPDAQARRAANIAYELERKTEARKMTTSTLINAVRMCLNQMPPVRRWSGADCVYDGQFYHVLLPEILKRLGAGSEKDEVTRRIYTEAANGEESHEV